MKKLIVYNPKRAAAVEFASELYRVVPGEVYLVAAEGDPQKASTVGRLAKNANLDTGDLPNDVELVISCGGDGTLLWSAEVAPIGCPVAGVNFGRLGYLTKFSPDQALATFGSDGPNSEEPNYVCQQRLTLQVEVLDLDGQVVRRRRAVNDVVLERFHPGRVIRFSIAVFTPDGTRENFVDMAADGVIFATPTGSTAYNLSVRGPIVSPLVEGFVMTPVAAHGLFDRSIVFSSEAVIEVMQSGLNEIAVVCDGRVLAELEATEKGSSGIRVSSNPEAPLKIALPRLESFVLNLRDRFGVAEPNHIGQRGR